MSDIKVKFDFTFTVELRNKDEKSVMKQFCAEPSSHDFSIDISWDDGFTSITKEDVLDGGIKISIDGTGKTAEVAFNGVASIGENFSGTVIPYFSDESNSANVSMLDLTIVKNGEIKASHQYDIEHPIKWRVEASKSKKIITKEKPVDKKIKKNTVKCSYCVDVGMYMFPSKAKRDAFSKNPKFNFDFNPSNVDDQEGLLKIFGTKNIAPIFKKTPPKFTVTCLEKNEDDDLGLIVSVELEMAFEIIVDPQVFRDWVEDDDSTWNYTGRIECVGEEGLDGSEGENYQFNW